MEPVGIHPAGGGDDVDGNGWKGCHGSIKAASRGCSWCFNFDHFCTHAFPTPLSPRHSLFLTARAECVCMNGHRTWESGPCNAADACGSRLEARGALCPAHTPPGLDAKTADPLPSVPVGGNVPLCCCRGSHWWQRAGRQPSHDPQTRCVYPAKPFRYAHITRSLIQNRPDSVKIRDIIINMSYIFSCQSTCDQHVLDEGSATH